MRTRSLLPLSAFVVAFGLGMAAPAPSQAQPASGSPSILIRAGTLAPEGAPWHDALREIADKWRQASGGRINLRIYGDGVTGDEPDMVRKMQLGQLQMGAFTAAGLEAITIEMGALSVPLLFQSDDELDYVRSKLEARLEQALGDQGFVLLTWGDAGWVRYFATKPIPTLKALQVLKLFTSMNNAQSDQMYKDAGFRIVPLDARDVLTGLNVGLIEAVPAPASAALASQLFGLAKYMMDIRLAPNVGAMVIAKATWDRIDPTLRPTLLAIARQTGAAYASRFRAHEATAIDTMVKGGLQIQELTPQAQQEWRQLADELYPRVRGTLLPADLFDDVTHLVSEYREQQKPEPLKQPEPATKPERQKTPELKGLPVATLSTVYVLDDGGRETQGMLISLDAVSIVIRAEDGTVRRYEVANVRRVSKRGDSLKNGAIIGAVFGAVAGALAVSFDDGSAGEKALGFLGATGFYALVGAGIDALIPGRTTIYEAWPAAKTGPPRPTAQRGLPGRVGVAFTVAW